MTIHGGARRAVRPAWRGALEQEDIIVTWTEPAAEPASGPREQSLDARLDGVFWGLLFILAGSIWLVPEARVPNGTWLIGIGVILLVPNVLRRLNSIPVRVLPSVLGAFALAAGLLAAAGLELPILSLALIVIGAGILLRLLLNR